MAEETHWGTGRRKSSVARVRLKDGTGKFLINDRELADYFPRADHRHMVRAPLADAALHEKLDCLVRVHGGGITGQAGAVVLGVARALKERSEALLPMLREKGYLTRDSREVERKKYGQPGARRRFQFSKR